VSLHEKCHQAAKTDITKRTAEAPITVAFRQRLSALTTASLRESEGGCVSASELSASRLEPQLVLACLRRHSDIRRELVSLSSNGDDHASVFRVVTSALRKWESIALVFPKAHGNLCRSPVSLTLSVASLFLVQNPTLGHQGGIAASRVGETFVEENLTQYISHLRRALGDNSEDTRMIVTIARKGYSSRRMSLLRTGDTPIQAAVQVSTADSSLADTQPALRIPADEAVVKALRRWRKATVMELLQSSW